MPTLTTTTLGRFCRELAGGLDDITTLLAEWQVTLPDWEGIQTSPAFIAEMQLVEAEMRDMGNDAGYVYRMKSLSEQMLPEVVRLLTDAATTPSMKFEMIKWVAEMARLKEKPVQKGEFSGPRGPTVVFKFGAGLPIQSMTVHAGEVSGETQNTLSPPHENMRLIEAEPAVVDASGWPQ